MIRPAIVVLAMLVLTSSHLHGQGASAFVPIDADVMPYVEHLIRAGVIRDPTPLTRPLRRGALVAALARADTSRASGSVRSTVRDLAARLADRVVEPDFRGRFYGGPYLATHARRSPLREAGSRITSFRAGMHLTAGAGPVALSFHVIDAPIVRLDPDYPGRTDDSLPFPMYVTDAYASVQGRYGEFFLGTMPRNWGPTGVEGEMASPEPYFNTHVMGRLGVEKLFVEGLYTQLDDHTIAGGASVKRHWATHRIFLRLFKWSTIVVTQGTLWYGQGRGPEFRWLNPLQLSEVVRGNENLPDSLNSLHGGQIYVTLPRRAVFQGALLIDDINNPLISGAAKLAPDRIVGTALLDYPVSPAVVLRGMFTGVTNLAYRSVFGLHESIMLHGVGLGRNFADYTQLTLSASLLPSPMLVVTPEFTLLNQGEGDFRIPFPNPANNSPLLYDGIVERTIRTAANGRFQLGRHLDLMGDVGVHFISNRNHVAGNSATRFAGRLQVQYQLNVGIPLH